jgi:hypothetical protein
LLIKPLKSIPFFITLPQASKVSKSGWPDCAYFCHLSGCLLSAISFENYICRNNFELFFHSKKYSFKFTKYGFGYNLSDFPHKTSGQPGYDQDEVKGVLTRDYKILVARHGTTQSGLIPSFVARCLVTLRDNNFIVRVNRPYKDK